MRRLLLIWGLLLAGLVCASQSDAFWQSRDSNYNINIAGGAAFSGPGDVVSGATIYYGFQCYNNAYSGSMALLTDSATGNTTATLLQCASGVISAAAGTVCTGPGVPTNTCSPLATTCVVACNVYEMFDQSGALSCGGAACPVIQATNANRPTFSQSCINSKFCFQTTVAGQQGMASGSGISFTIPQPFSMDSVVNFTATASDFQNVLADEAAAVQWFYGNSNATDTFDVFAGGVVGLTDASCTFNTARTYIGVINGAASLAVCGGTASGALSAGGTAWGGGTAKRVTIAGNTIAANHFATGSFARIGMWPIAFNSTQYGNLHSNAVSYWGVP
jgi:hypothetical protein